MVIKWNKKTVLPSDEKCYATATTGCKIIIKRTTRAIYIIKDYYIRLAVFIFITRPMKYTILLGDRYNKKTHSLINIFFRQWLLLLCRREKSNRKMSRTNKIHCVFFYCYIYYIYINTHGPSQTTDNFCLENKMAVL